MKASEQQALIPQEATPDTLIDLIGKTQQVTKSAAVVLKACRTVMDTKNKQEHIDKWGGIHAITEAVYDCADLAQRILDAGLAMENMCAKPATSRQMILIDDLRRSLDMDDGDVEATVDPDTGEYRLNHRKEKKRCGSSSTTRWPTTGASAACRSPPWDCGSSCASSTPKASRCRPRTRPRIQDTSTSSISRTPAAP